MSIQIIRERERKWVENYGRVFSYVNGGGGFSFTCDKHGKVDEATLPELARENYRQCLTGSVILGADKVEAVRDEGMVDYSYSYVEPAIGKCHCGREVTLEGFTNTCECGRDYNSSGQLLAPRSQWGEETGEHLADILRIR